MYVLKKTLYLCHVIALYIQRSCHFHFTERLVGQTFERHQVKSIWNKNLFLTLNLRMEKKKRKGMRNDACNSFCGGYVTETQQDDIFKLSSVQR